VHQLLSAQCWARLQHVVRQGSSTVSHALLQIFMPLICKPNRAAELQCLTAGIGLQHVNATWHGTCVEGWNLISTAYDSTAQLRAWQGHHCRNPIKLCSAVAAQA
jgi:hypothetical protein